MAKELEIVVPAVKPSVKADNDKNVKYELVEGDTALIRVNGTDLIDTVIPELTDGVKAVELHIVVNWKLLR